jgi:hypothetical protein
MTVHFAAGMPQIAACGSKTATSFTPSMAAVTCPACKAALGRPQQTQPFGRTN